MGAVRGSDIDVFSRSFGMKVWNVLWESWREEVYPRYTRSDLAVVDFDLLGVLLARDWRRLSLRGASGVGCGWRVDFYGLEGRSS